MNVGSFLCNVQVSFIIFWGDFFYWYSMFTPWLVYNGNGDYYLLTEVLAFYYSESLTGSIYVGVVQFIALYNTQRDHAMFTPVHHCLPSCSFAPATHMTLELGWTASASKKHTLQKVPYGEPCRWWGKETLLRFQWSVQASLQQ